MNITNFQYNQSPFSKIKRYEIHTLTEEGTNNYLKKDSYVHRFLNSLDHERIKEKFDYEFHEVTEDKAKSKTEEEEKLHSYTVPSQENKDDRK
jgi:hypothetical protein